MFVVIVLSNRAISEYSRNEYCFSSVVPFFRVFDENVEMIDGYSIDFPGGILQFLHREVLAKFKDKNNILLNTNANVGIVKYCKDDEKMEFAGANLDLVQVKREGIKVIEGEDKQVGEQSDSRVNYASISVGDIADSNFYLCSSGVFNLIGGPEFQKLSLKNLGGFWRESRMMEMKEQKVETTKYLKDWMGVNGQNDDIMIIGFKTKD